MAALESSPAVVRKAQLIRPDSFGAHGMQKVVFPSRSSKTSERALGHVSYRPMLMRVPVFVVTGEELGSCLLSSFRIYPQRLHGDPAAKTGL